MVKAKSNMYKLSVKQWNVFVGCHHNCSYCKPSFQRILARWAKSKCLLCYEYKPHYHMKRLEQHLPKTKYMQFIFVSSTGDLSFASPAFVTTILFPKIRENPDKTFLIQSKNPAMFNLWQPIPSNVILGTTLETTYDSIISDYVSMTVPLPSKRVEDFMKVQHEPKMVTIEPIMRFNKLVMLAWLEHIKPVMVWIGYNTRPKEVCLPEPTKKQTLALADRLLQNGYIVVLKNMERPSW